MNLILKKGESRLGEEDGNSKGIDIYLFFMLIGFNFNNEDDIFFLNVFYLVGLVLGILYFLFYLRF